jgi:YqaJ-like viral recombinase domain
MNVFHVEQGSEEWHRARAGVITASMASTVIDRLKSGKDKGDFSSKAKDYAFRLAVERISGAPLDEDEFSPWQAARGNRLEPEAKLEHEIATGHTVDAVGFVATADGKFGASADGFIGEHGGAEYKCFLAPSKLRSILMTGDVSEVNVQCQMGMAITGRAWWHFGLYCPALRVIGKQFVLTEIKRDDAFIDALWADLIAFDALVESYRNSLTSS